MKLPNSEQQLYGQEMKAKGYKRGYDKNTYDRRRRLVNKERLLFKRFNSFIDYLDEILYNNRRK